MANNTLNFFRSYSPSIGTISTTAKTTSTLPWLKKKEAETLEVNREPVLQSIFNFLRTGEYAMGGLLAGKGVIEGVKQKISPSTVLGMKGTVAKLATDILLDPTTYITLGAGGGMKLATKTGSSVVLNKLGTNTLKSMTTKIGEKQARTAMAKLISAGGKTAEQKYLAKTGLKFMGKEFVSEAAIKFPFKKTTDVLKKIPVIERTGRVLEKAFIPFSDISKLKPVKAVGKAIPSGEEYITRINKLFKGTQAEIKKALQPVVKFGKEAEKAIPDKTFLGFRKPKLAGEALTKYIESGVKANDVIAEIGDWMAKEHQIMAKIEKSKGLLKGELKTDINVQGYLRHFITEKGREFVDSGGSLYSSLSKPLRVKLKSANERTLRKTITEINKELKSVVGGDFFEPNAFKAFAARKAEHIKAVNTYDFLNGIKSDYGVLMTKSELAKKNPRRFIDGTEFIRSTNPQLKDVLLPKAIAQNIDETLQVIKGDEATNAFLKVYDKALSFWKSTVTGFFPAFHTRNFLGGAFNNWLAGIRSPLRYVQANELLSDANKLNKKTWTTKLGTKYTSKQLVDAMNETGVIGQIGMMDVMRNIEDEIGMNQLKKLGNYPQVLMEGVENQLRVPLFLDRVLKGDTFEEAAKNVFKYHFDYAPEALTAFERNAMRRLIPFYRWTRGNIPLQLEQIAKNPRYAASIGKAQEAISGEEGMEEYKYLPEWMKEQLIFRIGETGGKSLWLQLDLPIEDVAKLPVNKSGVREIVSMLSPLLKIPIEQITNKDLYFGTEIVNPDLEDYPELQTTKTIKQLNALPQIIKDFLNFREVEYRDYTAEKESGSNKKIYKTRYEMDGRKLQLMKSAIGRFYSTVGQMFDEEQSTTQKISRLLGGVPIRAVDVEEEKYWRNYEQEKALQAVETYKSKHNMIQD